MCLFLRYVITFDKKERKLHLIDYTYYNAIETKVSRLHQKDVVAHFAYVQIFLHSQQLTSGISSLQKHMLSNHVSIYRWNKIFNNSFQLINSWRLGAIHMLHDVPPEEKVERVAVRTVSRPHHFSLQWYKSFCKLVCQKLKIVGCGVACNTILHVP